MANISISDATKERLDNLKLVERESYNDVIVRLIENNKKEEPQ
jgi:predicted CopG family antitoxin